MPNTLIFKAFLHNYRAKTGVGVDRRHTTNEICIALGLAESGAHGMDGLITMDGLMKEPSAQVQHTTNENVVHNCMSPQYVPDRWDPLVVPNRLFSRHFYLIIGPKLVWEWIIGTQ